MGPAGPLPPWPRSRRTSSTRASRATMRPQGFRNADLAWNSGFLSQFGGGLTGISQGGDYLMTAAYLARGGGPLTNTQAPYSPMQTGPAGGQMAPYYVRDIEWYHTTADIKAAVMNYGAVATCWGYYPPRCKATTVPSWVWSSTTPAPASRTPAPATRTCPTTPWTLWAGTTAWRPPGAPAPGSSATVGARRIVSISESRITTITPAATRRTRAPAMRAPCRSTTSWRIPTSRSTTTTTSAGPTSSRTPTPSTISRPTSRGR